MPSPFPGFDPYRESPLYWQDFHERFLPYAAEALQPQLPPRYRARIGERVVLTTVAHSIIPDLDLPALFTRCYDAARYDLAIDYTQPPPVALSAAESVWLDGWLRTQGRRA